MIASTIPVLMSALALSSARTLLEHESHDLNRQMMGINSEEDVLVAPVAADLGRIFHLEKDETTSISHMRKLTSSITFPLKVMEIMTEQTLISLKQVRNVLNKILASTLVRVG